MEQNSIWIVVDKNFTIIIPSHPFLATTLYCTFFHNSLLRAVLFFILFCLNIIALLPTVHQYTTHDKGLRRWIISVKQQRKYWEAIHQLLSYAWNILQKIHTRQKARSFMMSMVSLLRSDCSQTLHIPTYNLFKEHWTGMLIVVFQVVAYYPKEESRDQ